MRPGRHRLTETIGSTLTTITPDRSTPASLTDAGAMPLPAMTVGQPATFLFALTLADSAGNAYQGMVATQPMMWTFTA